MRTYKSIKVTQKELTALTCDRCKVQHTDPMEIQEYLCMTNSAGYGSVFGDGNKLELDMCQRCQHDVLGEYIRIVGTYF